MTTKEHLLVVAAEECAEMQQAIAKILRFGVKSHHPLTPGIDNGAQLLTEYYQLQGVFSMLFEAGVLKPFGEQEALVTQYNKRNAVMCMLDVSEGADRLSSDDLDNHSLEA